MESKINNNNNHKLGAAALVILAALVSCFVLLVQSENVAVIIAHNSHEATRFSDASILSQWPSEKQGAEKHAARAPQHTVTRRKQKAHVMEGSLIAVKHSGELGKHHTAQAHAVSHKESKMDMDDRITRQGKESASMDLLTTELESNVHRKDLELQTRMLALREKALHLAHGDAVTSGPEPPWALDAGTMDHMPGGDEHTHHTLHDDERTVFGVVPHSPIPRVASRHTSRVALPPATPTPEQDPGGYLVPETQLVSEDVASDDGTSTHWQSEQSEQSNNVIGSFQDTIDAEAAATKRDAVLLQAQMQNIRFRNQQKIFKFRYSAAQKRISALETQLSDLQEVCKK